MEYTLIYNTMQFASLIKKENLSDEDLILACREMDQGLYDADLGGGVFIKNEWLAQATKAKGAVIVLWLALSLAIGIFSSMYLLNQLKPI